MTFDRVAWSLTVLVALITALLLLLSGYTATPAWASRSRLGGDQPVYPSGG